MDVSSLVTTITGYVTTIGTAGLAVLGVVVAIKAIGWVRRAI